MKQKRVRLGIICCLALGAGYSLPACEEEKNDNGDPVVDAGDVLLPIDACIKGGRDTLEQCSDRDMCNCDNACGGNFFEFEVPDDLPANLQKRLREFDQFENGIFYCYQKCGSGEECTGSSDACVTYNEKTDREIAICSPTGTVQLPNVPVKLIKLGSGFDIMELGDSLERLQQAVTTLDDSVSFDLGEQEVPNDSNQIAAVSAVSNNGLVETILIDIQFKNASNSQEWNLLIVINGAQWSTGATLDIEEDDFTLMLMHRDCKNKKCTNWIEGVGYTGKITLGEVFDASGDPTATEVSRLSIDVTVARNRVGNQPGADSQSQ